jgi:predicted HTH transcriptional regulator
LAKFDKNRILSDGFLSAVLRAKLYMAITKQIISYLYNELPTNTRELINKGESDTIEFKASASKENFPKIVQTIGAMLNSKGGTILLGVDDNGGLLGLQLNPTKRDVLIRNLNLETRRHLDEFPATLVHIDAEMIDNKEVIRIDCDPSDVPVFYSENGTEAFFVRISHENIQIRTLRDCAKYLNKRFPAVAQ